MIKIEVLTFLSPKSFQSNKRNYFGRDTRIKTVFIRETGELNFVTWLSTLNRKIFQIANLFTPFFGTYVFEIWNFPRKLNSKQISHSNADYRHCTHRDIRVLQSNVHFFYRLLTFNEKLNTKVFNRRHNSPLLKKL